uniref:MULE transposase domain-containing protein n=1 Tax=Schizaphis graminum TaxID=13262 RepID=A0A2S2NXU0_SCHGA
MEVSVMYSEKNKKLYIINGYKFHFNKFLNNNIQRWACTKRMCKAYFKLNENSEFVFSVLIHDHEKDDVNILTRQKVSNNLKRKALDDPCEKPSKILHRELREGDIDSLTTTDTMRIRKNIHYARSSIIPKLPKNLEDLHLALTNLGEIKTNRDEIFLLINNSEKNIVAFSTQTNLKYLTECDVLYVDGTFKSCPKPFYQLFIIHGAKNANYTPLVFFLLTGKTTEIYKNAFSNLINKMCELNLTFTPRIIYADFEQAIHSAISEIFPEVLRKGCRFHLGQTMWRKIQSIGLSKHFKKKSEIGKFLKLFFGLSFLKPEEVQQCFSEDFMDIKPNNQQLHDFCNFFEKNYILESCKFPPSIWAEFSNSLMRTTNACESFHSKLNSMFYSSYPNIFQFLEVLKNVQTDVYIKMRSSNQTQIRRKAVEKEDYIREIMRQYENKIITRLEFIEKLAYKNLPV